MSYKYSNIKAIEIQDFRNLGHVMIDFTKSNIICLKGGNEAGKSSVVLAMKSLGSMLNTKQYKEYIRTGTDAWTVMVYTMDNKAVYRRKTNKGQSYGIYQIRTIDGKEHYDLEWSIDKLDENAVPKEVQDILGLTTEPETGELLNIRTYEDKMLFVDTSGGTNYKVMYNALKIDNLSKAVKVGTVEAKNIKADIDKYTTSVETCKEEIRKVRLIDKGALLKIRDRIKEEKGVVEKVTDAKGVKSEIDRESEAIQVITEAGSLALIDEYEWNNMQKASLLQREIKEDEGRIGQLGEVFKLDIIDESLKEKCDRAERLQYDICHSDRKALIDAANAPTIKDEDIALLENIEEGLAAKRFIESNKAPELLRTLEIGQLDTEELSKVRDAVRNLKEVQRLNNQNIISVLALPVLDTEIVKKIDSAKKLLSSVQEMKKQVAMIDNGVQTYYAQLKAMNIHFEICPNCGELILGDEGHEHAG